MRGPPRIYPLSQNILPFKHLYVTLSDCTPPPQNIHPPFEHFRSICDFPRIYPSLLEYTRLLYKATLMESTLPFRHHYVQHSHDLPLPPRIYPPPFETSMRPSQNLPLPSRN